MAERFRNDGGQIYPPRTRAVGRRGRRGIPDPGCCLAVSLPAVQESNAILRVASPAGAKGAPERSRSFRSKFAVGTLEINGLATNGLRPNFYIAVEFAAATRFHERDLRYRT